MSNKVEDVSHGRRIWLAAGCVGFAAIVVLSLVPRDYRPHTGVSGLAEHFAVYLLVAYAFGRWSPSWRQVFKIAAAMAVASALLEVFQTWVPGRNPEVLGSLFSSAGAFAGAWIAIRLHNSPGPDRPH
jgi:VanZ family protein